MIQTHNIWDSIHVEIRIFIYLRVKHIQNPLKVSKTISNHFAIIVSLLLFNIVIKYRETCKSQIQTITYIVIVSLVKT